MNLWGVKLGNTNVYVVAPEGESLDSIEHAARMAYDGSESPLGGTPRDGAKPTLFAMENYKALVTVIS